MKSYKKIIEDIQPGYAPEEISFGGYTTKNLHHSADAAMAFQATIEKVKRGEIADSTGVLHALKATDTYMGLNDMHLEQGKAPDEKELKTWRDAHVEARFHLNKVGEFMHHMDYWHMHEHELQDMEADYTPETAGAEMADSYIPQNDLVESAAARFNQKVKQAQAAHEAGDHKRAKYHLDTARNFMLGINSNDHSKIKDSYPKYKELRDMHKEEVELDEALTDKTIKSGDKIKVARVIADMLGVENAETMTPEAAINAGLRKIKNKRMTPELIGVVKKMLTLAQEVGVKVDASLVPKAVNESEEVDKDDDYNIAKDILRFSDFQKLSKMNRGIERKDPTEVGHSLHHDDEDHVRRMKVKYKTEDLDLEESFVVKDPAGKVVHTAYSQKAAEKKAEELSSDSKQKHTVDYDREAYVKEDVASADYKVNPETGRKYRAHKIEFANSGMKDKLDPEQVKEEVEEIDFSEDDLEKMANSVNTEDDIMHAYDDGELVLVDSETGEEINEESIINTEILSEVMSRIERMRAKIRFARTAPKRERRMQIALKRRSDTKTLNKRARRVAIALMKQRIMKKPAAELTVSEKERVERMLSTRKAAIDRLAMKLTPRVRKIETDRLSHSKATQS